MSTAALMCFVYNLAQIWEGHGGKLNCVALVLCAVFLGGKLTLAFRGGVSPEKKLLRRLGVFLLGGCICPRCGDARVRVGGGYLFLFNCRGCHRLYFVPTEPSREIKAMWDLVWRKW